VKRVSSSRLPSFLAVSQRKGEKKSSDHGLDQKGKEEGGSPLLAHEKKKRMQGQREKKGTSLHRQTTDRKRGDPRKEEPPCFTLTQERKGGSTSCEEVGRKKRGSLLLALISDCERREKKKNKADRECRPLGKSRRRGRGRTGPSYYPYLLRWSKQGKGLAHNGKRGKNRTSACGICAAESSKKKKGERPGR